MEQYNIIEENGFMAIAIVWAAIFVAGGFAAVVWVVGELGWHPEKI